MVQFAGTAKVFPQTGRGKTSRIEMPLGLRARTRSRRRVCVRGRVGLLGLLRRRRRIHDRSILLDLLLRRRRIRRSNNGLFLFARTEKRGTG